MLQDWCGLGWADYSMLQKQRGDISVPGYCTACTQTEMSHCPRTDSLCSYRGSVLKDTFEKKTPLGKADGPSLR